jgi:hypothetical protein
MRAVKELIYHAAAMLGTLRFAQPTLLIKHFLM